MLLSLILILILSLLFLSFVPRVVSLNRAAKSYRAEVMSRIEKENEKIKADYDLY
jgi:competence protein ComGC